jgi:O-antigen ligase/polysaccharide polymerase Wzy-like membrane protein
MELRLTHARRSALPATLRLRGGPTLAAGTLGFVLPLYLALRGGGYEEVLRDQVGIALWWIVLVGALVGVLPAVRPSRTQLIALGSLVAFATFTGLGALWSKDSGRTISELSRLSCYAAALTLAVMTVRVGARRALLAGLAGAIGVVTVLALLSRFHPAWFPANETAAFLAGARSRLNYPLNYWNGLAALVAMGIPLMTHFAASARRIALRMLCAAMLPAMAATIYMTFSRGGWIETACAVLVLLALSPGRLPRIATLAVGAGAGALLIAAIHQRPAIDHGVLNTAAAHHAGNELIVFTLVVCAGAALLQAALALLEVSIATSGASRRRLSSLARGRRARAGLTALVVAVAAGVFVAAGGPHALSHAWQSFKSPASTLKGEQGSTEGRLLTLSGEGRYQMWSSSLDAFSTSPLGGIGAGTFQFWWAAHGSIFGYVINAHSLYFETLAETGILGTALLVLLLGAGLVGTLRGLARSRRRIRAQHGAIAASIIAFLVAAAFDWVWQLPVIPVTLLLLIAAGTVRDRSRRNAGEQTSTPARAHIRARIAWAALALLGAAAIVVPLASSVSLRSSQAQAQQGRLGGSLASARTAANWQPYASGPALQQALVLEQSGDFTAAAKQASKATTNSSSDWRAWLVLSRIQAERGDAKAALAAWRKARSLDPRDPLFKSR